METVNWPETTGDPISDRVTALPEAIAMALSTRPPMPPRSESIFTRPVLVGAGVGFLARGVTGAIVGAILGSFWKR